MRKAIISCVAALALLGSLGFEAAAQSSCSGWRSKCVSRCKQLGNTSCPTCTEKMAECRSTGCWTEIPRFGGGSYCNLKKS
jgi:hypothetical protein